MIKIPNGYSCSDLSVFPKNWDKPGTSIASNWCLHYSFHDPAFKSDLKLKNGKLVVIKAINKFKTLSELREMVKQLMAYELQLLRE